MNELPMSASSGSAALPFVKMEGAGNDYVYVDGFLHPLSAEQSSRLAIRLADRHFGVGGDGLIVLAPSDEADCRMLMWNADGRRSSMCGNGLRCVAKLAFELGYVRSTAMTIETDSGDREVELLRTDGGEVIGARVDMGNVSVETEPLIADVAGRDWSYHRGDAGNPHAVVFCDAPPDDAVVHTVGPAFQALTTYPDGVNVEFVHVTPDGALEQRTYERGSGETLACGTGATVAALAAMQTGRLPPPRVEVRLRGGTLTITRRGSTLVMEGPARTVFWGSVPFTDP